MIINGIYITLLAMLILSLSPFFTPVFEFLHVPAGTKTVAIQALALLVTLAIFLSRPRHKRLSNELIMALVIWLPFLLFVAARTDFTDHYSMIKFGKLFFIPFLSVMTITVVYLSDYNKFNKYFFIILVCLVMLQLVEAVLNPTIFIYASIIERTTIEGVNPIWLARSFVTAAICCLVMPVKYKWLKTAGVVIFLLAVVPTGSRGPLLSGLVGLALYLWVNYRHKAHFKLKTLAAFFVSFIVLFTTIPYLTPDIQRYISRDTSKGAFEESGRRAMFDNAIQDYKSAPVIGIGFGEFGRSNSGNTIGSSSNKSGYYPHNIILEVMAELGTIGLILLILVLRPGKYWFKISNIYQVLFIVYVLFSMTSGSIIGNPGVIIFGCLARLAYRYPHQSVIIR